MVDYYVATDGDDGNAGTVGAPFLTLGHAIWTAEAGDSIIVRAGVYSGQQSLYKGGSAGALITIKGYPGERPIIDGSGLPADTDLVSITASYLRFEGFEVRSATRTCVSVWEGSNVELVDNIIHDATRGGIWIGGGSLGVCSDNLVERNVVYDTCLENSARDWPSGWPRAIAIDVSTNTTIRGNVVFKNYGEGIGGLSSTDLLYTENIIYDNYSVQLYFDNVQDSEASNNIMFSSGDTGYYRDGSPGAGLLIANEDTTYVLPTTGITVQNNVFVYVASVYYDGSYGVGGGITNSTLTPNLHV